MDGPAASAEGFVSIAQVFVVSVNRILEKCTKGVILEGCLNYRYSFIQENVYGNFDICGRLHSRISAASDLYIAEVGGIHLNERGLSGDGQR